MTNPAKVHKKNRDKNLTFRGIILPFSLKKNGLKYNRHFSTQYMQSIYRDKRMWFSRTYRAGNAESLMNVGRQTL